MNSLTQNLQAAGLNPIVIDENTDMSTLPTPDTENAVETAISRFLNGAKALGKAFAKIDSDDALLSQRTLTQQLREDVTEALNGKGDFDAASKAYKAANNKLDKLIDANASSLRNARAGVDALRRALDALADDLSAMEARA